MHTHTKKTIAAPGLAEMLANLEVAEIGHPGKGWFSAKDLTEGSGLTRNHVKTRCDRLVGSGTYEECRRKLGGHITTFYRLKGKVPGKCSTRANRGNHETPNPVRSFPPALIPRAKKKRAGK